MWQCSLSQKIDFFPFHSPGNKLCIVSLLNFGHLVGKQWYLIVLLLLNFPDENIFGKNNVFKVHFVFGLQHFYYDVPGCGFCSPFAVYGTYWISRLMSFIIFPKFDSHFFTFCFSLFPFCNSNVRLFHHMSYVP